MVVLRRNLQARDKRLKIAGSPHLGVFARCTEDVVLVPVETSSEVVLVLEEGLRVTAERTHVGGSAVLGSLICGNSQGFVVTRQVSEEEMRKLSLYGRVARLPGKINAAGNLILANDSAALVHPGLSAKACEVVSSTLGVEVVAGTIGGLKTVGMTSTVTNRGLLVHPRVSEAEIAVLDDLFQLPVDVGTVNFGSPLVGSGLLANGHGYFAGDETTGPELGRVEDALGFLA
jgi:translation initiation factor 6